MVRSDLLMLIKVSLGLSVFIFIDRFKVLLEILASAIDDDPIISADSSGSNFTSRFLTLLCIVKTGARRSSFSSGRSESTLLWSLSPGAGAVVRCNWYRFNAWKDDGHQIAALLWLFFDDEEIS